MAAKKAVPAKEEVKKTVNKAVADTKKVINDTEKKAEATKKVVKDSAKKAVIDTAKKANEKKKAVKQTAEKIQKETKQASNKAKKAARKVAEKALTKELYFEYGDKQINADNLADMAVSAYKEQGNTQTVKSLRLYVKAEDNALYYVVNDTVSGIIEL